MGRLTAEVVVVVDDERSILNLVGATVKLAGLETAATTDPIEALDFYKENASRVPVVITDRDFKREDMKGEGFAERVRAIANDHVPPLNVRILMVTGDRLNKDEQVIVRSRGVDEIISKPFSPTLLRGRILYGREQFLKNG